uniref:LMBR1 domain-containing protein 2 homolog n=1 Tax=Erigeron canadensis TaxID=72917 RepID=UPI001CB95EBE|nr:LMBR1 domain-containing protein 2 homolog [Erigeron canadensis]
MWGWWWFYLISFPLALGMVMFTLNYFASPHVSRYVLFTVGYTWFSSISIIILVPADISSAITGHDNGAISFFWSWSYWSTFLLTWLVVPLIQGYEDSGDFTVRERLKTSIHVNLVFYLILGFIGLVGLILLIMMRKDWSGGLLGLAMACSNTFGLVTGVFLLGFGLSEIPKTIWRNADWTTRQKVLSHKVAKMAMKLDEAHQQLSNAIVVAQATSKQMSRRDPFKPYMDVIDNMINQLLHEDPSFKPQGGRVGQNDMDYDADEKSMATLRRHLRGVRDEYYRSKSQYLTYVIEALKLEDTIKSYERRYETGWKFVSSFRSERSGTLGSYLDTLELTWRCVVRGQLQKLFAVLLGCMSAAILLAEATLLPSGVDLSLFSILINSVRTEDMLVQVIAFVPLLYMCICTYYSLFQVGMLTFYSFTPRQTSSVSLLMICSMVARYAPPVSFNFLNLISLDGVKMTVFEKRMGNIDDAVPFFGKGFNKLYPLIMVVYTILVASGFFHKIISVIGKWKRIALQNEEDDLDGIDPTGLIILRKERAWLEQGHNIGEEVIALARNFNDTDMDIESGNSNMGRDAIKMKPTTRSLLNENSKESSSRHQRDEIRRYIGTREAISSKYAAIRVQQSRQILNTKSVDNLASAKVSLLDSDSSWSATTSGSPSSKISTTWSSMKSRLHSLKENIQGKKYTSLDQVDHSSDSLDEIFHKLKRPALEHGDEDEFD